MRTTDANCTGRCRCPWCKGPAFWSAAYKLHACADRRCEGADGFQEHAVPDEFRCASCGDYDCRCESDQERGARG